MTKICLTVITACLAGVCATSAPPAQAQSISKGTNTNPDAKMVADFTARVMDYVKLRDGLVSKTPPLKTTNDPAAITAAEKGVADQIRAARAAARRGDIFTPATEAMFRRLLTRPVKGPEGLENRNAIKEDAPDPKAIPFKVNATYPKDSSLSTVPPDVLLALPSLPKDKELEYRFVGRHLLLYDAKANLIVDFQLNALP